jgi:hypothetical protein
VAREEEDHGGSVKLILTRDIFGTDATLSRLEVDYEAGQGPQPFGFACEDEDRGLDQDMPLAEIQARKVRAETAIPVGTYKVSRTWSPKYKRMMALVHDVPGFQGIRIHAGNDDDDTAGCLLPGMARDTRAMAVERSRVAADWLDERINACEMRKEPVTVEIVRDAAAWAASGRAP